MLCFLLLVGSFFRAPFSFALEVAITMDDPMVEQSDLTSFVEVNQSILDTLARHQLKAYLFVCGERVDSELGRGILNEWDEAGHGLGDHTYSHLDFGTASVTLKKFLADGDRNERVLKHVRNRVPYFRFPFLHEGDTKAKRDGAREYLKKRRLRNGYVTIDASDWAISARLVKAQNQGSKALSKYRDFYIKHILDRVQYYDNLAKKLFKREIKHTLLLHHNVLNALFLGDLLDAMKKKGIRLIDAENAYQDPVYKQSPYIVPAGQSLIWALAKATPVLAGGLRYPGEDEIYEKKAMDSAGL